MTFDTLKSDRPIRLMLALKGEPRVAAFRSELKRLSAEVLVARRPDDVADVVLDGMIDGLILDSLFCSPEAVWLCAHLANRTDAAVIYVSDCETERLAALSQGADDCVATSCSPAEIIMRTLAIRRRVAFASMRQLEADSMRFSFEGYDYCHVKRRLVRPDGKVVHLAPTVASTLMAFLMNPAQRLSRDQLRNLLGKDGDISEVDLNVSIHRLRKALGEAVGSPSLIGTMRARGYRFRGRVDTTPRHRSGFEGESRPNLRLRHDTEQAFRDRAA